MSVVVAAPPPSGLLDSANPVLRESEASEFACMRVAAMASSPPSPASAAGAGAGGATAAPASAADSAAATAAAAAAPPAPAPPDGAAAEDAAPYYWESGGAPDAPIPVVIVHHVHYWFSRVLTTAELVGDFFSEFFGLYNSRYEWAMELERRHQEEAEAAELLEARRKRYDEARRLNGGKPVVGVPVAAGQPAAAAPEAAGLLGGGAGGGAEAAGSGAGADTGADAV